MEVFTYLTLTTTPTEFSIIIANTVERAVRFIFSQRRNIDIAQNQEERRKTIIPEEF